MFAMSLVEVMLVLAVAVGVLLLVVTAVRGTSRPSLTAPPRWVAAHHSDGVLTRVVVELRHGAEILESRRIASVVDEDPDYEAAFLEAMSRAQARAALLNSATDES